MSGTGKNNVKRGRRKRSRSPPRKRSRLPSRSPSRSVSPPPPSTPPHQISRDSFAEHKEKLYLLKKLIGIRYLNTSDLLAAPTAQSVMEERRKAIEHQRKRRRDELERGEGPNMGSLCRSLFDENSGDEESDDE